MAKRLHAIIKAACGSSLDNRYDAGTRRTQGRLLFQTHRSSNPVATLVSATKRTSTMHDVADLLALKELTAPRRQGSCACEESGS